jgi:hypothetical protein
LLLESEELDELIAQQQKQNMLKEENLSLTYTDIKNVSFLQNQTILAIKAPPGTTLRIPEEGEVFHFLSFFRK